MKKLIKEYHRFWTAVSFYSRLPVPKNINYELSASGEASKYLPIVGFIISSILGLVFYLSIMIFPKSISVFLTLLFGALLTGLIHEDGYSDFIDGFGGGWNKEKILTIMKDSSIGVFGTVGLIFLLGIKFTLLLEMPTGTIPFVIIFAGLTSRANAVSLMYDMNYARSEDSKSNKMVKRISLAELIFIGICGILPLVFFKNPYLIIILVALLLFRFWIKYFMNKWINGYTGDCLGFVQQISEIIIYLGVLLIIIRTISL